MKNSTQPGKLISFFSMIICIVLLIGCSNTRFATLETIKTENSTQLALAKLESAEEFYSISTGFVLFGRSTCSTCEAFFPILYDILAENNCVIYYFDTDYFRENSLMKEKELQELFANYKVLSVPVIIRIENYQVTNSFSPLFNEQRNNTIEVHERVKEFLKN